MRLFHLSVVSPEAVCSLSELPVVFAALRTVRSSSHQQRSRLPISEEPITACVPCQPCPLVVLHQLAGSRTGRRNGTGNTFLTVAFVGSDLEYPVCPPLSLMARSRRFIRPQPGVREVVPASLLCQQIALKLATAFRSA